MEVGAISYDSREDRYMGGLELSSLVSCLCSCSCSYYLFSIEEQVKFE